MSAARYRPSLHPAVSDRAPAGPRAGEGGAGHAARGHQEEGGGIPQGEGNIHAGGAYRAATAGSSP